MYELDAKQLRIILTFYLFYDLLSNFTNQREFIIKRQIFKNIHKVKTISFSSLTF